MELLAPAKDFRTGKIAINCGADAVYIGGPKFSARRNAGNSVADIAGLIDYAHRYLAKVYVAMNTLLLNDGEVASALSSIQSLYEAGADGVIIQDMGLLDAGLPRMPIMASTQTHNHDVPSVRFLEQVGFHRAILARELHVDEIAAIRAGTRTIELEAFVHGAVCVSYSGRCYLSAALGGRSANRGDCAQPCRKKYRLETPAGSAVARGHLLSMRDLCRIDMLDALLGAGVTSFKIEGRLKNAAYVANVVTAYRQALDAALQRSGHRDRGDGYTNRIEADLTKTFHRGYVTGFARREERMASLDTPKMTGEVIGEVVVRRQNKIRMNGRGAALLVAGDGVCFYHDDDLVGTRVQKVEHEVVMLLDARGIKKGTQLFRNRDHRFLSRLEKNDTERRVPVAISLKSTPAGILIEARDGHGLTASLTLSDEIENAQDPERMRQILDRQLRKSGDMEFAVQSVVIDLSMVPFLPVSRINETRRKVLLTLREVRNRHMQVVRDTNTHPITPTPLCAAMGTTVDLYQNVTNSYAKRFYSRCGALQVADGVEITGDYRNVKVMTSRYCLRRELGICLKTSAEENAPGPLWLRDETAPVKKLTLRFDCELCEMSVYYETATQSDH